MISYCFRRKHVQRASLPCDGDSFYMVKVNISTDHRGRYVAPSNPQPESADICGEVSVVYAGVIHRDRLAQKPQAPTCPPWCILLLYSCFYCIQLAKYPLKSVCLCNIALPARPRTVRRKPQQITGVLDPTHALSCPPQLRLHLFSAHQKEVSANCIIILNSFSFTRN